MIAVVAVAAVEVAEFDSGGQLLGDDGGEWIAENSEVPASSGCWYAMSWGSGVMGSPRLTSSRSLSCARAIEAGITSRSPW